jgi:hypothetical protein
MGFILFGWEDVVGGKRKIEKKRRPLLHRPLHTTLLFF